MFGGFLDPADSGLKAKRTTEAMAGKKKHKKEKKQKKEKKRGHDGRGEVPQAYFKDVGSKGIKKNGITAADGAAYSVGGHEPNAFRVKLTKKERARRSQRMERFAGSAPSSGGELAAPAAVSSALSASRGPAAGGKKAKRGRSSPSDGCDDPPFVGKSRSLEKAYLRLTTFPKPEDVRPLPVLAQALSHIKRRYHTEEDFEWANEQLKSVRQDLTVQGHRNALALDVYETHARLALEEGQLNEFNQCQTKIRELTVGIGGGGGGGEDEGLEDVLGSGEKRRKRKKTGGKGARLLRQARDVADEFGGYRLLYALVQKNWGDVTKELAYASQMAPEMATQTPPSGCRHAIEVTTAVVHGDYHSFFALYDDAPHLSCYLMDFLVNRIRSGAYDRIIAAYRPNVEVDLFRTALHFTDLEETRRFLKKSGAAFVRSGSGGPPAWVDCKLSTASASNC